MTSEDRRQEAERYRSLFEGAQASLADLSARQAQALSRVGRLRNAVVTVLRRNFMELSAEAEAQLGRRLSEIDDEILIAYLDAFVSAASRGDQRATLQAMAEAVMGLGVPLRGDEPLLWVEQIHQHRSEQARRQSAPSPRVDPADQPTSVGAPVPGDRSNDRRGGHLEDRHVNQPAQGENLHQGAPAEHAPRTDQTNQPVTEDPEDYWGWDPGTTLKDLFGEEQPEGRLGSLFGDVEKPALWGGELGTVGGPEQQWTPSPVAPATEPKKTAPEPRTPEKPAKRNPSAAATPKPSTPEGGGPEKSGEVPAQTSKANPNRTPRGPARQEEPVAPATPTTQNPDTPSTQTLPPQTGAAQEEAAPTGAQGADDPAAEIRFVEPGEKAETPQEPPQHAPVAVEAPLRPELFAPQPAARRKRTREVRAHAKPPEEALPFTNESSVLDDQMRRALLAACSIPRPVFTRDLVAVAGSDTVVDAWEAECRAEVSTSPVRFVAPKSRHRQRGRLVAVEQDAPRPQDWWYQAVSRYRAGRLYELGVLLHRVGDEIVSFQLGEQVCLFRLNTPRGLVGIVVVLDLAAVENHQVIEELTTNVEQLLSERLTLLAVLTASGEPGSLEGLVDTLERIAGERSWRPTSPIVAARSWEYADDRGSSAIMVMNQA